MSAKSPHVEIYRSGAWGKYGGWRWRFRSSNGKILSQSSEAYNDPRDLVRGLELSFPAYELLDAAMGRYGVGSWYLWPTDMDSNLPAIPVRVPDGTVKLWRARRKR